MKTLFILLFLAFAITCKAQSNTPKIDTIYYDKNWQVVATKHFADYYRLAMQENDSYIRCRDFYITGELQADGMCSKLGNLSDSETIWNGKVTTYGKNGNVLSCMTYSDGVLNGECVEYYKNGLIKWHAPFINGKMSGEYLTFNEEGTKCKRMEMLNGEPCKDYYEFIEQNGSYGKFRLSDNSLIWEEPSILDKKEFYSHGEYIQYYQNNGLTIMVSLNKVRDYGKYYKLSLIISNNSYDTVDFNANRIFSSITGFNAITYPLRVLSAYDYEKTIRKRQNLTKAFFAIGEVANAAQAGYSSSQTNIQSTYGGVSSSYETATAIGGGGYAIGASVGGSTYAGSSNTTITTNSYNGLAAYQASVIAGERITALGQQQMEERIQKINGYVATETLFPGNSMSGYFLVKYKNGTYLSVNIILNGIPYKFYWQL